MSSKWSADPRKKGYSPAAGQHKFLPPSHYAVAGGFSAPPQRKSASSGESSRGQRNGTIFETNAGAFAMRRGGPSSLGIGPGESTSESSFDYRTSDHGRKPLGEAQSTVIPRPLSSKRSSQGIPNAEADLLPSLQTTIGRMTRPPTKLPTPSASRVPVAKDPRKLSTRPAWLSPDSTPRPHAEPSESRVKAPQKSSLKSALRTPIQLHKPAMSPAVLPETPKATSPRTPSLRSVRSLISRRLQSGTTPQVPSNPKKTSNLPIKSPLPSSLPRPKVRADLPSFPSTSTVESDVEKRYERAWMDGRRLTVANAEISSTSSSESDMHAPSTPMNAWPPISRGKAPYQGEKPVKYVGLGFDLPMDSPVIDSGEYMDRAKILRFSLPPSHSSESFASNRQYSYPGEWGESDYPSETDARTRPTEVDSESENENVGRRGPDKGFDCSESEDDHVRTQPREEPVGRREWSQKPPVPPKSQHRPPAPRSISQLLSQRHTALDNSPRNSPRSPAATGSKPRSPVTASPHRVPKHSPMLTMSPQREREGRRRSLDRSEHAPRTWFNESSHDLEASVRPVRPAANQQRPHFSPTRIPPKATLTREIGHQHAIQERRAFGLPPSDSDEFCRGDSQRWSGGSSYRSSVTSDTWRWDEGTPTDHHDQDSILSAGAETMLRTISLKSKKHRTDNQITPQDVPRFSVLSATSTGPSIYDDEDNLFVESPHFESEENLRGHYLLPEYQRNRAQSHDQHERERGQDSLGKADRKSAHHSRTRVESKEELVREFIQTEEAFLANAQTCVNAFVLPIRAQDRKAWIGGVPANVSRLLDWYEDIINLHVSIIQTIEMATSAQGGYSTLTSGLAGCLLDFIPKLHVYQPYLVRLSDVLDELVQLVSDPNSDFGEFIRMQERSLQRSGWTLERLLMEPVHRLAVYQEIFTRLLSSTPPSDREYLATYTLTKSTDAIMKVLTEVKLRENEHKLIRALAAQISEPSVTSSLATRERRLLYSGTLRLISPALLPQTTPTRHTESFDSPRAKSAKRSNRLVEAISTWDRRHKRTNSLKSTSSTSVSITSTTTSALSLLDNTTPQSGLHKFRDMFKRKPDLQQFSGSSIDSGQSSCTPPDRVQVFVFSDLLLLISPRKSGSSQYDLLRDIGVSRIFSVARDASLPEALVLQVIPTPRSLNTESIPRTASLTSVTIQVISEAAPNADPRASAELDLCLRSLEQSRRHTLQSIAFSGFHESIVRSDFSKDTWLTVSSLMASGLPMPRSPSGDLPDLRYAKEDEEAKKMEREERGWWTLRYQQVLGEIRREMHVGTSSANNSKGTHSTGTH